jgi:lipopolysaccharide transport system permease protein
VTVSPTSAPPAGVDRLVGPLHVPRVQRERSPTETARYLKDVTLHLVGRQLAARYRRSLFGWLWALAPAVAQLAVVNFVFTKVIPVGVADYAPFLFVGIIAWGWLATSLTLAAGSIEARRDLVMRPGFPTALLPLVSTLVALVDFVLALPVLFVLLALYGTLTPAALFLPVILAIELLLIIGISWLAAPINVFFRDVGHLVGVLLLLGYFLTPIFYAREQAPSSFSVLYELNPMAHLIDAQRAVLLDGELPAFGSLALVAAAAAAIAAAGYAVFALVRHALVDQL